MSDPKESAEKRVKELEMVLEEENDETIRILARRVIESRVVE